MYSKARIAVSSCCAEAAEQAQRGVRTARAAERTFFARPREQSFSTAAVMMPSVPSAPTNRWRRRVAGVVLAQPAQPVPDLPVRQHHLQPEHQVARIAVAHRVVAAGIGGEHAADLADALATEGQRQQAAGLGRRVCAAFTMTPASIVMVMSIGSIARTRFIRASDRTTVCGPVRRRAADHGGVAALRHDRHAGGGAELHADPD